MRSNCIIFLHSFSANFLFNEYLMEWSTFGEIILRNQLQHINVKSFCSLDVLHGIMMILYELKLLFWLPEFVVFWAVTSWVVGSYSQSIKKRIILRVLKSSHFQIGCPCSNMKWNSKYEITYHKADGEHWHQMKIKFHIYMDHFFFYITCICVSEFLN